MPMVFPIQTRMKARIMWFRYPLRALWKDYKDFVGNFREGLEEPYLDINTSERLKKMCSTGSLGDYLGLPTTLVGSYGGTSTPLELSSSHWYSKMGYYIADVSNNRGVLAGTPGIVDASSYMQLRSMLGFTNNNTYVYPASTGATFDTGIPVGKYFQADCTIDDSFVQSDYDIWLLMLLLLLKPLLLFVVKMLHSVCLINRSWVLNLGYSMKALLINGLVLFLHSEISILLFLLLLVVLLAFSLLFLSVRIWNAPPLLLFVILM